MADCGEIWQNDAEQDCGGSKVVKIHFRSKPQVAQLSQRDRAAGFVSFDQKWKTGKGIQYLRTL